MTQHCWFIGIDPGFSGGISVWNPGTRQLSVFRMPTLKVERNGKLKSEINKAELAGLLGTLAPFTALAAVERVGVIANEGHRESPVSAFQFGKGAGIILGVLAALSVPVVEPPPATWKKYMGVPSDKTLARQRASVLFPGHADKWIKAKDDGLAEAAMLALYAQRHGNTTKEK